MIVISATDPNSDGQAHQERMLKAHGFERAGLKVQCLELGVWDDCSAVPSRAHTHKCVRACARTHAWVAHVHINSWACNVHRNIVWHVFFCSFYGWTMCVRACAWAPLHMWLCLRANAQKRVRMQTSSHPQSSVQKLCIQARPSTSLFPCAAYILKGLSTQIIGC